MTLSGSLSNAFSGLAAAAQAARVVSSNVSNALTEGYAPRRISLASVSLAGVGTGVRVVDIQRETDRALFDEERIARATRAAAEPRLEMLRRVETAIGLPGMPGSLTDRMAQFESALITAAGAPERDDLLEAAVGAASRLSSGIGDAAEVVQSLRGEADQRIAEQVRHVDDALRRLAQLNGDIRRHRAAGRDATALMDERQRLIDGVAGVLPLRETSGPFDQIRLVTPTGLVLLDGSQHARLGFTPAALVSADTSREDGGLSGLTIDGLPADTERPNGPVAGGSLAALFALRDSTLPGLARHLDSLAADLVGRFSGPGADLTLAEGQPGLFQLSGPEPGADWDGITHSARRLAVAPALVPEQGGAPWRLRAGLAAADPGATGDPGGLLRLREALDTLRPRPGAPEGSAPQGAAGHAAELLSRTATARLATEAETVAARTRAEHLDGLRRAGGVDTDSELQRLLAIEKSFAANARVLQAVDEMMRLLFNK